MKNQPPRPRWESSTRRSFWRGIDVALLGLLALLAWWLGIYDRPPLVIYAYFVVFFALVHNALLWGVIPFSVRRTRWFTASSEYAPFDPHDPDLPDEIGESVGEAAAALRPHGFRVVVHLFSEAHTSPIAEFATVFDNPATGDMAVFATFFVGGVARPRSQADELKFVAAFTDGTEIVTVRDHTPATLPPARRRQGFNFPTVRNPGRLFLLHRALVARSGKAARQRPLLGDAATAHYRRSETDNLESLAAEGYVYRDARYDVYRLTVKGVYRVLWRLRWPMRAVFEAKARRREARLLRELSEARLEGEERERPSS